MKPNSIFTALICLLSLGMGYLGVLWGLKWKQDAERAGGEAGQGERAGMQAKINLLEEQLGLQKAENDRLNLRIEELQAMMGAGSGEIASFDGPVLESLRGQIEGIRGIRFVEDLAYHIVSREEVAGVARERLLNLWAERDLQGRRLAYAAMGFIDGSIDLGYLTTELRTANIGAFYDKLEPAIFIAHDLNPRDLDDRLSVASAQVEAMIDQNFKTGTLTRPAGDDEEAALAFEALLQGDISLVLAKLTQKEMESGNIEHAAGQVASQRDESLSTAPLFLRDLLMFPTLGGGVFCRKLFASEQSSFKAINAAYEEPPRNSSEIFHEEKFLQRIAGDRSPVSSDFHRITKPEAAVADVEPVWSDIAGELRIRMLFKPTLVPKQASEAGIGWKDDRYWVFEMEGAAAAVATGDPKLPPTSVVWKTSWDTAGDTAEFYAALMAHLRKRYRLPDAAPDAAESDSHRMETGERRIVIYHLAGEQSVLLVDAASEEWLEKVRESPLARRLSLPGG